MRTFLRLFPLVLLAATLHGAVSARADAGPQLPCGGATYPPYPDVDQPPAVNAWNRGSLGRDWTPPSCTGWESPGFTTLVVAAARFRQPSGVEGLLRRLGAISQRTAIRYWTTTRKRWQPLIIGACALPGPDGEQCRNDFSPDEMMEGTTLYFRQEDNLLGTVSYRMRIRSVSPDRLVFQTENVGTVRRLMAPMFPAGEFQSLHFLERESGDVWCYYGILRTGCGASSLTAGREASYINRMVAFYRYLAGIPTDREPPAAP